MTDIRNILILVLAAACAILFLTRGCGRGPLGGIDCPTPKEVIKYVTVKGEVGENLPIPAPKESFEQIPITKPILVAVHNDHPIYVQPTDTAAILLDWMTKREYDVDRSDSNITASVVATVQYNRLQNVQLHYEFVKQTNTSLYDRFQMHTIGKVGATTDLKTDFRPRLGAGFLLEFKTGTGTGLTYDHTIGSAQPHSFDLLVTQRISFRKRK